MIDQMRTQVCTHLAIASLSSTCLAWSPAIVEADISVHPYDQFQEAFGCNLLDGPCPGARSPVEVPDYCHPGDHITYKMDDVMGPVFAFHSHPEFDDDHYGSFTDRARTEVLTRWHPPGAFRDHQRYIQWFVKIDQDFIPTQRFTHIFQMAGNYRLLGFGRPLFTLSLHRSAAEGDTLQIRHRPIACPPDHQGSCPADVVDSKVLQDFTGQWVRIWVHAKFSYAGYGGSLTVNVFDINGNIIWGSNHFGINMWDDAYASLHPKWGLYRGIHESQRDEIVLMNHFCISTSNDCPVADVLSEEYQENVLGHLDLPLKELHYNSYALYKSYGLRTSHECPIRRVRYSWLPAIYQYILQ